MRIKCFILFLILTTIIFILVAEFWFSQVELRTSYAESHALQHKVAEVQERILIAAEQNYKLLLICQELERQNKLQQIALDVLRTQP